MTFFGADVPLPRPNQDDAAFWDWCAQRQLRFQACADCGRFRHPPSPVCATCGSMRDVWIEAPKEATVFTYTVVHHAAHPGVRDKVPYVVAVVEFDGMAGVRLVSNVDAPVETVHVGQRLDLWWDQYYAIALPRFRPQRVAGASP